VAEKKLTWRLVVDAAQAGAGLKSFGRDAKAVDAQLDATEKNVRGRVKGAFAEAATFIQTHWVAALTAAGAVAVTFGAKAVQAFQDTALGAGKMADATGLAVSEASRWREVAGDLGVSAEAVTTGLNRMNRAAASGELAKLGITTANTNEQFVRVLGYLDSIPSAAKRASEGTRLLGKGWQELAPLVAKAGELRQRLAEVSEQKVIDDDERRKAERLRDSLDALKDSGEDLALTFGEELAPAAADFMAALAKIASSPVGNAILEFAAATVEAATEVATLGLSTEEAEDRLTRFRDSMFSLQDVMEAQGYGAENVERSWGAMANALGGTDGLTGEAEAARQALSYMGQSQALVASEATNTEEQVEAAKDAIKYAGDAAKRSADVMKSLADAERDAAKAADDMTRAHETLADAVIDVEEAGAQFAETLRDEEATAGDARDAAVRLAKAHADQAAAQAAANGEAFTAADRQRVLTGALLTTAATAKGEARNAILAYIGTLGQIPAEKMTAINAAIDQGDVARAQRILDILTQQRTVNVRVQLQGTSVLGRIPGTNISMNAAGGNLGPGELGVVSETHEPEIVRTGGRAVVTTSPTLVQGPASITGVRETARQLGSGGSGSETIVVPVYLDGRQIAEAIVRRDRALR
jgi:hypothetical protein